MMISDLPFNEQTLETKKAAKAAFSIHAGDLDRGIFNWSQVKVEVLTIISSV